jgi:ActR/RegA family two-component response regulator
LLRETQSDLRVILMPGYTVKAVELKLGPRDSFLQKPALRDEVERAVREALDRRDPE